MIKESIPEKMLCLIALVGQLTRSEKLDLASLAHGKTRRLAFTFEDDKIRVQQGHDIAIVRLLF